MATTFTGYVESKILNAALFSLKSALLPIGAVTSKWELEGKRKGDSVLVPLYTGGSTGTRTLGSGPDDDVVVNLGDLPRGAASLVVRNGPQAGASMALDAPITRLGRSIDGEISLDDITVSRRHAEIVRDGANYVVRDAGSLNGTYVNHTRIDEVALSQGDELQIGKFRLVFFQEAGG